MDKQFRALRFISRSAKSYNNFIVLLRLVYPAGERPLLRRLYIHYIESR